jgi:adenylosuccinate lyase
VLQRYESKEIEAIFSDVRRMTLWRDVELAVVRALADVGRIPARDAELLLAQPPEVNIDFVEEVRDREKITDHDLAAFVDVLQAHYQDKAARFIHFGLTSSDVVDSAFSLQLCEALDVVIESVEELRRVIAKRAVEFKRVVMLGRTHGMAAEPTTFGAKLVLWALAVDRSLVRLKRARDQMRVGKLSGAVGTYSNISPDVEKRALALLDLAPVPSTQVIARDRHAEVIFALASLASIIETFATEIRHLQRSEVREVQEPFAAGQKGSSAMPHKRNPILSERLCGMARVLRSYVAPALEDVALWHERDISHSSVERIVFPDAFHIAHYMTVKATYLISNLIVDVDRMRANLDSMAGLVFSQTVLLALVERGMMRDDAYRVVQRAAANTISSGVSLIDSLADDPDCPLSRQELDAMVSVDSLVSNTEELFQALGVTE